MSIKTTALETSKLLKEANFPQNGIGHYWVHIKEPKTPMESKLDYWKLFSLDVVMFVGETLSAPTTDELLEELPSLEIFKTESGFEIVYDLKQPFIKDESLPEALAQMWLYLKKESV